MTARRSIVALVSALWLLPGALAAGVALHVAFDHGHDQGAPAGHHETRHAVALTELLEHGHAHVEGDADHEHVVTPAGALAVRTARASILPLPSPGHAPRIEPVTSAALALGGDSPRARPPKAAGPPLLALLATLRI